MYAHSYNPSQGLLLVGEDVANSVLGDATHVSSGESPLQTYLVVMDVSKPSTDDEYAGFFRVCVDTLLSQLYPKL